ncbi:MAG: hypothetical protein Q4A92_06680 [Corynebacterium sp.]|nr:hypothetical protein [Corynebacterium sp.]
MNIQTIFEKRSYWHTLIAVIIGVWSIVGAVTLVFSQHWWHHIHVFTLGVLTNAIIAYSTHFAQVLTHSKKKQYRSAVLKMVLVTISIITLFVWGVQLPWSPPVIAAVIVIFGVALWHLASLYRVWSGSKRSANIPALSNIVVFYIVAALFLAVAVALIMAGYLLQWNMGIVVAAHSRVALWGFAWTTIFGTSITMIPMLTRTRYSITAQQQSLRALGVHSGMLVISVLVMLLVESRLAGIGFLIVAIAGAFVVGPVLLAAVRAPNQADWDTASVGACAAMIWIIGLVFVDAIALICGVSPRVSFHNILPALLGVGIMQLILSVLLFLLPAMIGRGPSAVRVGRGISEYGGPARLVIVNYGGVLTLISLLNPLALFPGMLLMALGLFGHIAVLIIAAYKQFTVTRKRT